MTAESRPEENITTTQYSELSAPLFVNVEVLEAPFLQDRFGPIVDARDTLQATRARFESPFFISDETARKNLLDVVDLLTRHTEISQAMWTVVIDDVSYTYTFEEQFDETENLISIISYDIAEKKQLELEEFKVSENVHMVTLQKTEQQVYIKTEVDLHAEYETLEESGIKVSGYNVRLNEQNQIEAEFGGKWYKLEDVVVKDSEMYSLLMQVTKALENGQTAFTVTTHGISAGTSKKIEVKAESAEYIINIFDIANGRVYNYVLVDKSLQDVQQILAKYGIQLNLENPDLTFGAVNNFNKEEFEKDNFGKVSLENNIDSAVVDSNFNNDPVNRTESIIFPFNLDFAQIVSFEVPNTFYNSENLAPIPLLEKDTQVLLVEDEPVEPTPTLDTGLLIIVNTESAVATSEKSTSWSVYEDVLAGETEVAEVKEELVLDTSNEQVALNEQSEQTQSETSWQVYDLETYEITDQSGVNEVQIEQEQYLDETVEFNNETFQIEVEPVTKQGEILQTNNVMQFSEIPSSVISLENNQVITQTQNIDLRAIPISQEQTNNTYTQELRIAEQIVLLQEQFQSVESEYIAKHLSATADKTFTWPHTMTATEARAIQKDVEAKTGRTVIEIRTSPNGKLQVITI